MPQYGAGTYEWEADGHVYEATIPLTTLVVYEQEPNSEIMAPVSTWPNPDGYTGLFVDVGTGNVWGVTKGPKGGDNVVEYPLISYASNGACRSTAAASTTAYHLVSWTCAGSTLRAFLSTSRASLLATQTAARYGATGNPSA